MIGTDEMSSTGMDISESFRPEDITKSDFFDFVSATDMDIGIGVSLHTHSPHMHQHHHSHERTSASSMTHDGGGGDERHMSLSNTLQENTPNTNDPTLQAYEFWHPDKDHNRLDSTIFEDLDRYCWQQTASVTTAASSTSNTQNSSQQQHHHPQHSHHHPQHPHHHHLHHSQHQSQQQQAPPHSSSTSISSPHHQLLSPNTLQPAPLSSSSSSAASASSSSVAAAAAASASSSSASSVATTAASALVAGSRSSATANHNLNSTSTPTSSGSTSNNSTTVSTIDSADGQIYTITVLNGNEPWLKRENDTLQNSLDLDSLLGSFPGYIKSEYPYDDSGFSTDGPKDVNGVIENGLTISNVTSLNCINQQQQQQQQQQTTMNSSVLPSLVSPIGGNQNDTTNSTLGQQLAQFQNNNNDWHMADHNADQNSAESLLRSALQGKGYSKGLHMQNGLTLLPTSPTVKEEDMRRMLFSQDADSLSFADSTLNAAQIFDDTQSTQSHSVNHLQHSPGGTNGSATSLMVDDMFLSLDNDFTADFEKIKRIANEVQQYCSPTTPSSVTNPNDYLTNDVMMQISPGGGPLQQLHSPATTPTGNPTTTMGMHLPNPSASQKPTTTTLLGGKGEISTTTGGVTSVSGSASSTTNRLTKTTKKYKRSTSSTGGNGSLTLSSSAPHHNNANNNNNNPNVMNHNATGTGSTSGNTMGSSSASSSGISSGSSSTSSSNSPPTHCNGQRKERSLHYCSICAKGFKDKYSVNVHIRTHTGEKPFACSLCGKSFRQKAHLAKHYQTHMAQKNNGSVVKGGSAKHRNSNSASSALSQQQQHQQQQQQQQQQQRQLSLSNVMSNTNVGVPLGQNVLIGGGVNMSGGVGVGGGGLLSPQISLANPSGNILPPATGLLANR